jgi:hypothetical protein
LADCSAKPFAGCRCRVAHEILPASGVNRFHAVLMAGCFFMKDSSVSRIAFRAFQHRQLLRGASASRSPSIEGYRKSEGRQRRVDRLPDGRSFPEVALDTWGSET